MPDDGGYLVSFRKVRLRFLRGWLRFIDFAMAVVERELAKRMEKNKPAGSLETEKVEQCGAADTAVVDSPAAAFVRAFREDIDAFLAHHAVGGVVVWTHDADNAYAKMEYAFNERRGILPETPFLPPDTDRSIQAGYQLNLQHLVQHFPVLHGRTYELHYDCPRCGADRQLICRRCEWNAFEARERRSVILVEGAGDPMDLSECHWSAGVPGGWYVDGCDDTFLCDLCGTSLSRKQDWDYKRWFEDSEEDTFECQSCGRELLQCSDLRVVEVKRLSREERRKRKVALKKREIVQKERRKAEQARELHEMLSCGDSLAGGPDTKRAHKTGTDEGARATPGPAIPTSPSTVVLDGLNICRWGDSREGKASLDFLLSIVLELLRQGQQFIALFDAVTPHALREEDSEDASLQYAELCEDLQQWFVEVPGGIEADVFVLQYADRMGALVISNDKYKKYADKYPWVSVRGTPRLVKAIPVGQQAQIPQMGILTPIRDDTKAMVAELKKALKKASTSDVPSQPPIRPTLDG